MTLLLEPQDIHRLDIKYREKEDVAYGYAVVHLKEKIGEISTFHFTFSMSSQNFKEQLAALEKAAEKGSFRLDLREKSRIGLTFERLLASTLAGTQYRNRGCPACRMIDTFIAGGR
ncbi:MAG: hypothetical protein ACFFDJ_00690 [Candidatus Odinarchaeota archaeon]